MIKIENLSKRFKQFTAVDDLSFEVFPGEVLGFLGPNGAGKSTTMKMLTGYLSPSSGKVFVDGCDVEKQALMAKRQIGYLPEGAPCYGDMTTRSFLEFVADIRGLSRSEKKRQIDRVVENIDLGTVLEQTIETLSKGFKRRVGLAQAILHDPRVLILDEPTDGLDPNQKHQVRQLIKNLSREKIVIISTHILEEVSAVCSRAIIISNGRMVVDSTPRQLDKMSAYHNAIQLKLMSALSPSLVSAFESLPNVERVEYDELTQGLTLFPKGHLNLLASVEKFLLDKGIRVLEVYCETGRLDDVFRKLTTGAGI